MANKTMRFLSLLLALVMVIGMMPMGHVHAEEEKVVVLGEKVTEVKANETYVITLAGTKKAMTNQQGSQGWGTHTLATAAVAATVDANVMWTLETADGGFKIKNGDRYLVISRNTGNLNETGHVFAFNYTDAGWAIKSLDTNEYFNDLGAVGSIGGWREDGTKFDIYTVVEKTWDEIDPYGKVRGQWSVYHVDTQTLNQGKEGEFWKSFDNNPGTHWHSNWQGASDQLNGSNSFAGIIDLGKTYTLNWVSYAPRQDQNSGYVTQASIYVSNVENPDKDNAEHWTEVAKSVTFANDNSEKTVSFAPQSVRYVKFVAEASSDGWVTASEFNVGCNHEHEYTPSVTTAPTCTEAGVMTYTCSCGDSYTEPVDAAGHDYKPVVTDPTCTADGYTTFTCTKCGDDYTEAGEPATGHSYDEGSVTTAPTCTEAGVMTYTCACGHSYTEEIKATGHDYKPSVTDPTCTADGYTTFTCTKCGDDYTEAGEPATGHSYDEGSVTTAPTCTEAGVMTYTCACGHSYTEEIKATGHRFSSVAVTSATCTEDGYITITCGDCGGVFVSGKDPEADQYLIDYPFFKLDATGHNYETVDGILSCTNCGEVVHGVFEGRLYNQGVLYKAYQLVNFEGDFYFINGYDLIAKDGVFFLKDEYVVGMTFDGMMAIPAGLYEFGADGKMILPDFSLNGIVDDQIYINGVKQLRYQTIMIDGDYYFINDGDKIAKNCAHYLKDEFLTGTDLKAGLYKFDAEGKLIIPETKHGVVGDYLYINNEMQKAYQLVEFENHIYFVYDSHKLAKNCRLYLTERFTSNLDVEIPVGFYEFDENGWLIIP